MTMTLNLASIETMTTADLEALACFIMDNDLDDGYNMDVITDELICRTEAMLDEMEMMDDLNELEYKDQIEAPTKTRGFKTLYDYETALEEIEDECRATCTSYRMIRYFDSELLVTERGDIYNLQTLKKLTQTLSSSGYYTVGIKKDGKKYNELVHRIIGKVFIPNPDNLETVDHIKPNKATNGAMNLQWMTQADNSSKGNKTS